MKPRKDWLHPLLPALAIVLLLGWPASADFQDGRRAHDRGDYAEALREWLPLAEEGRAEAQHAIALMYAGGRGVRQDDREALTWLRRAADQGFAAAQVSLAYFYAAGRGVPQSDTEAFKWYRRAAEQGHGPGQSGVGLMYLAGLGAPQSDTEALKWLQRSADQGDSRGQLGLGGMYENGRAVPQDYAEAVKWYRLAAGQGNASAQYALGAMHAQGKGVPRDDPEAVNWFRLAADQGNARGQNALGVMYANGRAVVQDDREAVKWYRRAADQGDGTAQSSLGFMYSAGRGVPQDFALGYMWYTLAASRLSGGARDAVIKSRDTVGQRLSPVQLAAAQQAARNWKPRTAAAAAGGDAAAGGGIPGTPGASASRPPGPQGGGTGFVVNVRGHVLTNYHVIGGCREVHVRVPPGQSSISAVIASDRRNDLAVLAFAAQPQSVASFRDGRGIRQGDPVTAIGFPLQGLLASGSKLTTGVISALAGMADDTRYLQITAPVQPGNSGGPLLDEGGNVVGVVVSKLDALRMAQVTGDIPQNINFALNASVARSFLEANNIEYERAASSKLLSPASVAERAKGFTALIECWK